MTDTIIFSNTSDHSDFRIDLFIVSLGARRLIISVLAFLENILLISCSIAISLFLIYKTKWRNEVLGKALRCQRHIWVQIKSLKQI